MFDSNKPVAPEELDALRLFALGRVPRCARCPRYGAMLAFAVTSAGLPGPPAFCSYQICAPLAARLARPATTQARPAAARVRQAARRVGVGGDRRRDRVDHLLDCQTRIEAPRKRDLTGAVQRSEEGSGN